MAADQELMLIFGALHLMALLFGGLLLRMFFRSEAMPAWRPPEDDEDGGGGGGGGDDPAPDAPGPAGSPLERSERARVRLREPARLADRHPFPVRRPEHAPRPEPQREREPA